MDGIVPPSEKQLFAQDLFEWFQAFRDAGFDKDDSIALLVAGQNRSQINMAGYPPEMAQLIERQTKFFEQEIGD